MLRLCGSSALCHQERARIKKLILSLFFIAEGKSYPPKNLPKLLVIAGGKKVEGCPYTETN